MDYDVSFRDFHYLVRCVTIMLPFLEHPYRLLLLPLPPLRVQSKMMMLQCQILMNYNYLALALILRRFLCNLRVRFFFHFQRILAVDFLNGHP